MLEEGWMRIGLRCSRSTSRGLQQASPLYLLFHLLAALPSVPLTPGTTATCAHFFETKFLKERPSEDLNIFWASWQYVTRQFLRVFATLPFSGAFSGIFRQLVQADLTASTPCRFPITIKLSFLCKLNDRCCAQHSIWSARTSTCTFQH